MGATSPNFIQTPQPDGPEIASKIMSLVSFTVLATLFGIKTYNVQFKYLTYSRWLVLALYVLSWAFTVISMILVTTNNANYLSCFLSIMVCDVFYSGTKLVIYAWLIEKVYTVSSTRESRWKTISYRFHVLLMIPYIAILTLMLIFHTSDLEDSGVCIIGLQSIAAIPLIAYDFAINLYMTILFVLPLLKLGKSNTGEIRRRSRLQQVALRTLVASVVCLVVSFANIFSLQMLNGRERGLVCLSCCTVDVTINVITVHWVTSQTTVKRDGHMFNSTSGRDSHQDFSSNRDFAQFDERYVSMQINHIQGFTEMDLSKATIMTDSKLTTTVHCLDDDQVSIANSSIPDSPSSRQSLRKN